MTEISADLESAVASLEALAAKWGDRRFTRAAEALYAPAPTTNTADRKRRRQAIRAMAAKFYPNDKPKPQAMAIECAMRRYHDRGGWSRDHQGVVSCPPEIAGKIEADIWCLWMDIEPNLYHWRTFHRDLTN